MNQSKRWTLNKQDLLAWGKNALWFLAPTLVVFIPSLVNLIPSDFKYAAIVIYILNRFVDLLRRYATGK